MLLKNLVCRPRLNLFARAILTCSLAMACAASAHAEYSQLWGKEGERWDPRGRLPDYSYAGYHAGEKQIPDVPVVTNVRDFGAVGDGKTDDTEAFKAAIEATHDGALLIPAGRYVINDILTLNRDGVVLRGEGAEPGETTLYFPRHLTDLTGRGPKPWEYGSGGLIWIGRNIDAFGPRITTIAKAAKRGDKELIVQDASGLKPDQFIAIELTDDENYSLMLHLHNNQVTLDDWGKPIPGDFTWPVKIKSVSGNRITLAQPLRIDFRMQWKPTIVEYNPVREVGVENLRIVFPNEQYRGHHQEKGYNGLSMTAALNSWARNITIQNAENGVDLNKAAKHCELQDIRLIGSTHAITTPGPDQGTFGHHGVSFQGATDCLLSGLKVIDRMVHDVTMVHMANGNVVRRAVGLNLSLDHHRYAPFENLFTDINAGLGTVLYSSSGPAASGPHSGARETFWNIRSSSWEAPGAPVRNVSWGRWVTEGWEHIQTNVIPASTDLRTPDREWLERVENIEPRDLYQAQLAHRLGTEIPEQTQVATPVICPQKRPLMGGAWVTLLCLTEDTAIHYTTDGSTPTEESPRFDQPVVLKENITLRARAFRNGLQPSEVSFYRFEIDPDNEAPVIEHVSALGDPTKVLIVFSEEVESRSANISSSYTLNNGAKVLSASAAPDSRKVALTTTPLSPGQTYEVTASGVRDRWDNPVPKGSSASFTFRQPEPTLVAHYTFDHDATDQSGNGYNATLHGAVITEEGRVGGAALLDGKDDYISLPPEFLSGLSDFTFAGWIYLETLPRDIHIFNFNMGASGPGIGAYAYLAPFYHGRAASLRMTLGGIVHDQGPIAEEPWPTGRWVHVAVTLQGEQATLYTDGQATGAAKVTVDPRDLFATAAWLGRNVYPDSPYLQGRLDDIRIYNYALPPTEIQALVTQ